MNHWECGWAHCGNAVVGLGGAVGLRAIGWFFRIAETEPRTLTRPLIRCPVHHPHPGIKDCKEFDCPVCLHVKKLQAMIEEDGEA